MKEIEKLKKIRQRIRELELELKRLEDAGGWCGTSRLDLSNTIKELKREEKKLEKKLGIEGFVEDFDNDDEQFFKTIKKIKRKRK